MSFVLNLQAMENAPAADGGDSITMPWSTVSLIACAFSTISVAACLTLLDPHAG